MYLTSFIIFQQICQILHFYCFLRKEYFLFIRQFIYN